MSSKPHIVLLPGAWHTPECYSIIRPKLESHGYTIHTRQLPSVGSDNPPEDLSQDIAAVRELVTQAIGSGNDVVVVPHSWSGIVAGSALEGYSKKAREAKGEKGGVIRCGYMCSFMAPEGVSLCDAVEYKFPDWWGPQGGYSITNPKYAPNALYNDLPEDERQKWYAKTTTHSYGSKTAKASAMSWKEIPTSYLLCEDDLAIPMPAQEAMTSMVKDMGGDIEVERIKCSHSPFLSQPDYTVDWIRRVAGEKL